MTLRFIRPWPACLTAVSASLLCLYRIHKMLHNRSLQLYRRLLRDARAFPVPPIRRKLEYNYKEMFDLHRDESNAERISELMLAGEAALRTLKWLRNLPQVGACIASLMIQSLQASLLLCKKCPHQATIVYNLKRPNNTLSGTIDFGLRCQRLLIALVTRFFHDL